jgi:RNA polymerase sigma-70 factor (ECF subfamily)
MEPAEEKTLLARCRDADAEAWDALFDAHYAPACRFVYQLGHRFSWEDAEEICQEAFVAVVRNLPSFKGECRLQTWIFRIATNKARDYRDRQAAAKRGGGAVPVSLQEPDPHTGLAPDPPDPAPGPDAALLASERLAQVGAALERLGNPCQELLELRYFGDLGYEEISAALRLNPKTVSSRLSKCLDKLEALLRGSKSAAFAVQ